MYLVVRTDVDLLTGQLVNLFVERVVTTGDFDYCKTVRSSIIDNIITSYKNLGIKYNIKEYPEGVYIKAEVCMVILSIHQVTNGSMPLYHHDVSHDVSQDKDYVLNDAAKAISTLAHTTLDNAKGILSCFGYEIDGKPFMLADKPVDGEKQVGMTPEDFHVTFASLLNDDQNPAGCFRKQLANIDTGAFKGSHAEEDRVDYDNITAIMLAVDNACCKNHVDRKLVYDNVKVGDKTLSEWRKEGVL